MIREILIKLLPPHLQPKPRREKEGRGFLLSKRQKFVISVAVLSLGLFFSEYLFSGYGVLFAGILAVVTDALVIISLGDDLMDNFSVYPLILPFLWSLSFGFFYFLAPARLLTRLILTTLFAIGMYSVLLSENIFVVGSIRTIALLSSARIVTFVISLVSYFFVTNTIFSFRLPILPTLGLFALFTFLFFLHSIWTYTLGKSLRDDLLWNGIMTLCLTEFAGMLWFWPTPPTVFALFIAAMFYILTGLTHVWLDKRLFKSVLWEYLWVAIVAVFVLFWFSSWQ
ncbi:MAG TPA: hypothetical protein VLB73_04225 [Patescibacteria group bacterium]|nr:hypothetical protein [Patescibacteria group bacterium]